MFENCTTALITPVKRNSNIDYNGLKDLVEFQIENRVSGLLACGTTGESPTLDWNEHIRVIEKVLEFSNRRSKLIAGTGSNCTDEAIDATGHAAEIGIKAVLLVDPYYNGPSSLEIMREYYIPVARKFSDLSVIPYIIPGRTGTQLYPQDLAMLNRECPNINTVKEATGNLDNMRLTRKYCGPNFSILSGDDDKTFDVMQDPLIKAVGVISVASNVIPGPIQEMTSAFLAGDMEKAKRLNQSMKPLFSMLTVKTEEDTAFGSVTCRARNPLPIKTLMNILGMPSGPCRKPLGRMTRKGLDIVLNTVLKIQTDAPELFRPIEKHFGVSIDERLHNRKYLEGLSYDRP